MIIDKDTNTVRFRFTVGQRRRGLHRMWLTSKGRGRLQGVLLGVTVSVALAAAWSLSSLEIGELLVSKPVPGVSHKQAAVQTSVLTPELRTTKPRVTSTPLPSPAHDWPRRALHLPAAYHLVGHAVMARALGITVGEIELEIYGGCRTCHNPGVLCPAYKLDSPLISPRKNAALLYTAGWAAARIFGHAGSFEGPDELEPDYLSVEAQARELGLSVAEVKRQTLKILNRPGNRRAVEALAQRLVATGRLSRDEVERICAQSQSEQSTTKKGDF